MHRWVGGVAKLHFYLDRNVLKAVGVSKAEVERASRDYLTNVPNVACVAIGSEIREEGQVPGCSGDRSSTVTTLGEVVTSSSSLNPTLCPRCMVYPHHRTYIRPHRSFDFLGERFRDRIFANTPKYRPRTDDGASSGSLHQPCPKSRIT